MKLKKYNAGVDVLRIVSMLMIIILHVLGHGGVLEAVEKSTVQYKIVWFFEIAAYCAVNCYALISGFVGVKARIKYSNILYLWLQVAYYSVGILVLFYIFNPESVNAEEVINALFPVMRKQYWYFSAYFIVFFIGPAISFVVKNMNSYYIKLTVLILIGLFSVLQTVFQTDVFQLCNGYSPIWLAFLYFLGAYIGKYNFLKRVNLWNLLGIYIVIVALTWGQKIYLQDYEKMKINLVNYTSPTILLASIVLLLFFSRLTINKGKKIIKIVASLSFSVYLIHDNPLIRNNFMLNHFSHFANETTGNLLLCIIGTISAIYICCSLIDLVRFLIFYALNIKNTCERLENYIKDSVMFKITEGE